MIGGKGTLDGVGIRERGLEINEFGLCIHNGVRLRRGSGGVGGHLVIPGSEDGQEMERTWVGKRRGKVVVYFCWSSKVGSR